MGGGVPGEGEWGRVGRQRLVEGEGASSTAFDGKWRDDDTMSHQLCEEEIIYTFMVKHLNFFVFKLFDK